MERQDRYIPNSLEYFRKINRLSQKDVTVILNLSNRTYLSKWERGVQLPTMTDLIRLSALFKVSPRELYPEYTEALQAELAKRMQEHLNQDDL